MLTALLVLAATVAAVLLLAASKPATFRVERSATIKAPLEKVFMLVNDFHHWPSWSPWEPLDPAMTKTHSGAANGPGAVYAWKGNKTVGEGRMEITDASPPTRVVIKLDFLKPFEAHNVAEFTLVGIDGTTVVTWAMYGPANFMTKVMQVFTSMDRMVGKDFEAGLSNLKALAEAV